MRTGGWILWMAAIAAAGAAGAVGGCGADDDGEPDTTDATDVVDAGDDVEAGADADADADDVPAETGDEGPDAADAADAADVPDTTLPNVPLCEGGVGSGTRRRWVDPVSGLEYCEAPCRDCEAVCLHDGTRSEGWYAVCDDPSTEAGCYDGEPAGLIAWMNCM